MAERRIEDAPLAIGPRPGERPAIEARVHAGCAEIDRGRVEAQQHTRAAIVEVSDLVDFGRNRERRTEKADQRTRTVGDLDGHTLMPGMLVEIAADQLEIFWP